VTTARLVIAGVEASGRHGASPGERDHAQTFVVDLDVLVDVGADTIEETADYREVVAVTRDVVERRSFVLLETLASAVAGAVRDIRGVRRVRAVVRKPAAAEGLGARSVAAEAVAE
jgi:7,8-dihydroneopterin aldolase/epimerase/oxygenase